MNEIGKMITEIADKLHEGGASDEVVTKVMTDICEGLSDEVLEELANGDIGMNEDVKEIVESVDYESKYAEAEEVMEELLNLVKELSDKNKSLISENAEMKEQLSMISEACDGKKEDKPEDAPAEVEVEEEEEKKEEKKEIDEALIDEILEEVNEEATEAEINAEKKEVVDAEANKKAEEAKEKADEAEEEAEEADENKAKAEVKAEESEALVNECNSKIVDDLLNAATEGCDTIGKVATKNVADAPNDECDCCKQHKVNEEKTEERISESLSEIAEELNSTATKKSNKAFSVFGSVSESKSERKTFSVFAD